MTAGCPKCGAELRPGAGACGACGLAADRFDGYRRDLVEGPPEVVAAWQACLAAWEDDSAHERFRALASATEAFAFAAGAYRQAARERAGDSRAAAGLARLQRMAEAALLTTARPGRASGHRPRRKAALLFLLFVLLGAVAAISLFMLRAVPRAAPEPPAATRSQGPSGASMVE